MALTTTELNNPAPEHRTDIVRTLAVLRELSKGHTLWLPFSGQELGMGNDMSVGFVYDMDTKGKRIVNDFSLSEINDLLEKNDVGLPLPRSYKPWDM